MAGTGNCTPVFVRSVRYLLNLFVQIFLVLYAIGLTFLRRQYIQERSDRLLKEQEPESFKLHSAQ